jgi:hypothetical protein
LILDPILNLDVLATLNTAIYALLIAGVALLARRSALSNDPSQAFLTLAKSIENAFRDVPAGYTMREGIERARELGVKVDWTKVGLALERYESWRYGMAQKPSGGNSEVIRLAKAITRTRGRLRWLKV